MKDIPQLATEIKRIIEDALCKPYRMSSMDKSAQVYANVEVRFRMIEKLKAKQTSPSLESEK